MKTYSFMALLVLASVSFAAEAAPKLPTKRVLISVGDLQDNKSKEWKKSTCLQVYNLANQIVDEGVDITCREFNTDNFLDKDLNRLSEQYDYHLRVMRLVDGKLSMDATNWSRKHDSDFKTLAWDFKDPIQGKASKEDAFTKVIGNFFLYAGNEKAYKAGLLVNGIAESDEVAYDQKNGYFLDKRTNTPISIDKAVTLYENESPRKKNYLRTGIEIGVQLSAAMAIYYKNLVFNQVDFDYTLKSGLKGKFITGDAILFDDNDKMSNYGHVYAGVMYYQTARSNGFNSLESALITFASSAAWEVMEYHEVLSINDQIMTPIGGYVIGEATYQIACALVQKDSYAAKALGYTINPNLGINHAMDKAFKGDKYAAQPDCKRARWNDISVYVGLDKGQKAYEPSSNNDYIVGMQATVANIDGYNKEGSEAKMVYDTAMTKMLVEANGNQGLLDLKVVAQITAAAYYKKDLKKDERGQLRGYDVILGVGSASTYYDRGTEELSAKEDFYGTINILGATAHTNIHYNGFNIKADIGFYGDFAMVKAYSLEPYKESRGGNMNDQSSIMKRKGYYWGAGTSAIAAISISKGRVTVGYEGQMSSAKSINSRNRVDATSGDVYRDSLSSNKISISYSLTKNVKVQLSREYITRKGSVNNEFNTSGTEVRTMGTLVYKF